MNVLYVASEAVPFAKTGGLADVAGSLPKALRLEGVDVRVIMPKFGKIPEEYRSKMEHVYDDISYIHSNQHLILVLMHRMQHLLL